MDRQMHQRNGTLVSFKKGGSSDTATIWMSLEDIMLSEMSQSQTDTTGLHPWRLLKQKKKKGTRSHCLMETGLPRGRWKSSGDGRR
jgi:hypothetical protein